MKKFYEAPELELIRFTLKDDILGGSQEGEINNPGIIGDDEYGDDLLDP